MLQSGMDIEEIARMLDAEQYLYQKTKKGHTATGLNAQNYLNTEARKPQPIKLPEHTTKLKDTILPPDEGEIITGSGAGWEEGDPIPRSRYLQELLTELGLEYSLIDGTNTKNMVRRFSYKGFVIPDANKLVMVNDQEGEATYIIHSIEEGGNPEEVVKRFKKSYWRAHPELASVVEWRSEFGMTPDEWKAAMTEEFMVTEEELARRAAYSRSQMLKTLGVDKLRFLRMAEPFRTSNPEWFVDIQGREFYHRDLLEQLLDVKAAEDKMEAAADDITMSALVRELETTKEIVEELVAQFPEDVSEHRYERRRPKYGGMYEYLSSTLADFIRGQFRKQFEVPTDWIALKTCAKELGIGRETLGFTLQLYAQRYPDDIKIIKRERLTYTYISPKLKEIIRTETEQVQRPGDDWASLSALAEEFGVSFDTVQHALVPYIESHAEEIRIQGIHRGKKTTYCSPRVIELLRKDFSEAEQLVGWMTANELAEDLGCDLKALQNIIRFYQKSYPEFVKKVPGKKAHYLSPEMINMCRKIISERISPQDGWVHPGDLTKEFQVDISSIQRIADVYRMVHPDWLATFYTGRTFSEYLSPELVDEVHRIYEQKESPPPGWISMFVIHRNLDLSDSEKAVLLGRYKREYPDSFGLYFRESGQVGEFCAPDAARRMYEENKDSFKESSKRGRSNLERMLIESERASDDWYSYRRASASLNMAQGTFDEYAEKHRAAHPEWFQDKYDATGQKRPHFAQALIDRVREEAEGEHPPEGWMTAYDIASQTGVNYETLKKRLKKLKDQYMGDSKMGRHPVTGQRLVFYSPEMIERAMNYGKK